MSDKTCHYDEKDANGVRWIGWFHAEATGQGETLLNVDDGSAATVVDHEDGREVYLAREGDTYYFDDQKWEVVKTGYGLVWREAEELRRASPDPTP